MNREEDQREVEDFLLRTIARQDDALREIRAACQSRLNHNTNSKVKFDPTVAEFCIRITDRALNKGASDEQVQPS